jgi:glycosyltransferase involved in cell wall biosynthesis
VTEPAALRIALVNWSRGIGGGTERYLAALAPRLLAEGHAIAAVFEEDAAPGAATIDGGDPRVALSIGGGSAATRFLRGWAPDVLYLHGVRSLETERTLVAAFPSVLFAHSYYGTCATGTKRHTRPEIAMCARTLGPACLALDYFRGCGIADPVALWRTYRLQTGRRALLGAYQAVAVASRHMRDEMARHGVPEERLHIVPLPATDLAPDPEPPARRPLTDRILFLGRLTDLKGGAHLIAAAAQASAAVGRPLSLVVAGSGPEESEWRALAERLRVPAEFPGYVDGARRTALLRAADAIAVPSLWPEPFGLTGIEAGCVGVPAVAYAVGGIPEWLTPGVTGELAPGDPPTVEGFAEALVRALGGADHRARLARGAWETARRFSMDHHLGQLAAVLASAASGAGSRRPASPAA